MKKSYDLLPNTSCTEPDAYYGKPELYSTKHRTETVDPEEMIKLDRWRLECGLTAIVFFWLADRLAADDTSEDVLLAKEQLICNAMQDDIAAFVQRWLQVAEDYCEKTLRGPGYETTR